MSLSLLFVVLLGLTVVGYYFGKSRSLALTGGQIRGLHSLPMFYGWYVVLWCGLPTLLLFGTWIALEDWVVRSMVVAELPEAIRNLPADRLGLVITDIRNLAYGNIPLDKADPAIRPVVDHYISLRQTGNAALWVMVYASASPASCSAAAASRRIFAPATGSKTPPMSC